MPQPPAVRCTGQTRQGRPCLAWAVRGSSPPRCSAHGGRSPSPLPADPVAAEPEDPASDAEAIASIIRDLAAKQQRLSALIDSHLNDESLTTADLARLLALHGLNASRLGRLLRDKRALSGDAADGLAGAIGQVLDELSSEWGVDL
jgi:plasmid maintenance system antidote protein VapI